MSKYIYDPSLVGKHTKFNKKLHEKYDLPARKAIKEKLEGFVEENPDIYKQDFIIKDEKCKYKFLEVQVVASWVNEKFPFEKVYLYERKGVYGLDTLFITLNKHFTRGVMFDAESFKNSSPRRFKKYSREYVYDVPWHRALQFPIECLDKELVLSY